MKLKLSVLAAAVALIILSLFWMNSERPLPKTVTDRVDNLFTSYMQKYNSPCSVVGIWIPGKGNYVKAFGRSDIVAGTKAGPSDIFRIGSLTKTLTATVILQLVDEGKIELSDPLSKYEPWVPNSKNITVKQLLNMTSGLHNYTEIDSLFKGFTDNRLSGFSPYGLVKLGTSHKPDFKPGQGLHYSNTNYILLGMIIEKVTGNKYEDELKTRIVDRLRLKKTYYPRSSTIEGDYIRGYMTENGRLVDWSTENISWGWAAGGMISNIYDLKRYVEALCDGTFLSKELQKQRLSDWVTMNSKAMPSLKYGLGVFTLYGYVGHNGGLPGYISMAMHDPKTKATVVFMFNNQADNGNTIEVMEKIIKLL